MIIFHDFCMEFYEFLQNLPQFCQTDAHLIHTLQLTAVDKHKLDVVLKRMNSQKYAWNVYIFLNIENRPMSRRKNVNY
jgi:hypothetical protein